jgi:hypothetical protein
MAQLAKANPEAYGEYSVGEPYPILVRQSCDLCFGHRTAWEWACEFKLCRLFHDNGKPNDDIFKHILSPYQHRLVNEITRMDRGLHHAAPDIGVLAVSLQ